MATVTKTVRIDEEMMDVLSLYKKAVKKMFKIDCNINSMLEGSIIRGFESYLQTFRLMRNESIKNADGYIFELPQEAIEALDKYEKLLCKLEFEEMQE